MKTAANVFFRFPANHDELKLKTLFSFAGRPFLRRGGRLSYGIAYQDGHVQKVGVVDVKAL